jgi:hypothetical protein
LALDDDQSTTYDYDWVLPPHLTRLECRNVGWSQPSNFGALTQLYFYHLELFEDQLLKIPSHVIAVKVGSIRLHGLTAKDDSSLTHLCGRAIIDRFQQWQNEQKTRYGRVIFSFKTRIVQIFALPPKVQTISRKLRLSGLELSLSPSGAKIVDPTGLLHIPSTIKSLNAFTFDLIRKEDICRLLDDIGKNDQVTSLVLPQQLAHPVGSYFCPPLNGFRISAFFDSDCLAHLPTNLTKLTFSDGYEEAFETSSLPKLPNLEELVLRVTSLVARLYFTLRQSNFLLPKLRKLSFPLINNIRFGEYEVLPQTLEELSVLRPSPENLNFPSYLFQYLPRGLKSLVIQPTCYLLRANISALPQGLTRLEVNFSPWDNKDLSLLPKDLIFLRIHKKRLSSR